MELRSGFAALLLAVALGACSGSEDAPAVSSDRMTALLVDLHLAHARIEVLGPDSTDYVDSLLDKHGVSSKAFNAAMQFYARHPDQYVALMDSVIDRMRVQRPSADVDAKDPLFQRSFGSVFRDTLADLSDDGR